jgi:hypothetical protein
MLQSMQLGHGNSQDEQDRRWQNMAYESTQLKDQGKEPATGGEIQALIVKHGLQPICPLRRSDAQRNMRFDEFMNICGNRGWQLMDEYEAMHQPDAPRKCDCCGVRGAQMRCYNCGETYCNTVCQTKEWKIHRKICCMAGRDDDLRRMPELYTWEEYDVRVLRKRPSTSSAASDVRPEVLAAVRSAFVSAPKKNGGAGKNAKKNKKKREKAKAERAAASAHDGSPEGNEAAAPVDDIAALPAYADID